MVPIWRKWGEYLQHMHTHTAHYFCGKILICIPFQKGP